MSDQPSGEWGRRTRTYPSIVDPLLTAAMIVRGEESHLPACLESIRDVVDEIVIVDTGSKDETVSIARSFGALVHVHPWSGNFAEARNVGLELATGTWILCIDADERLRPISPATVRARLETAAEIALRVRLRLFAGATPAWEYRLWRSDPRIRYVGKMHERVTMAIRSVAEEERRPIGESELLLDHVGYHGDQTHKHARNVPLLRAQLADDPIDTYSWHHLAVALDGLGEQVQSEAALEQALEVARETRGSAGVLAFLRLIEHRREHGEDPTDVLEEALTRYPDSFALAWLKLLAEIKAGRYEHALCRLELFDVEADMPVEDAVAYASEMFGARAAEARGVCLFKLGRYGEAAAAYAQAELLEPHEPAHRLKRVLAEHRMAQVPSGPIAAPRPGLSDGFRWPARSLLRGLAIDIGDISVGIGATDAMRATAVRALLGRVAPSDRRPAVHITFGGHRPPLPERDPDVSVGAICLWYDEEALSVAYGPLVGARVESGFGCLGGYAENLGLVFRHVAPFMLASLLGPHGRFILHGGAIQRDGRAVLILGGSGMGKSTLVLGALQDGWSVLADDLVLVRAGASGPLVKGIPKPLVVPGEVLSEDLANRASIADPRGRVKLPFVAWDPAWRPVTTIVAVGHGDRELAVVEPIKRPGLLGMLISSMPSREAANVRRYFSLAVALCDVQAYHLRHSRAPEGRAREAAHAIAAQLSDQR
jgi:tetratricopeptide (TPR) repeat protein